MKYARRIQAFLCSIIGALIVALMFNAEGDAVALVMLGASLFGVVTMVAVYLSMEG